MFLIALFSQGCATVTQGGMQQITVSESETLHIGQETDDAPASWCV
jgi:hypothetical protein